MDTHLESFVNFNIDKSIFLYCEAISRKYQIKCMDLFALYKFGKTWSTTDNIIDGTLDEFGNGVLYVKCVESNSIYAKIDSTKFLWDVCMI